MQRPSGASAIRIAPYTAPVRRRRTRTGRRWAAFAAIPAAVALAAGCGGDELDAAAEPDPPVGSPVLPDLAPKPQYNVLTQQVGNRWRIRFTTTIVNVGEGPFILRATRFPGAEWRAEQDVAYTESGAEQMHVGSVLVWGGDGHEHWHVERVAVVRLVPLDDDGKARVGAKALVDTKVGFCFYDHTHELGRGPEEAVYSAHTCGHEDDTEFGMGLSPGWNDTYLQSLPGQSIDITDLADGQYRLFTEIDEQADFREATRSNNLTWIDLDVQTTPQGRIAIRTATGPQPS
jgi:lysyl oxidase